MTKYAGLLAVLVLAAVIGGAIYLATFDLPAPTAKVEKVIPDDRFPR